MINATLTNEKRYSLDHLENHAANGPDVDHCGVLGGSEY